MQEETEQPGQSLSRTKAQAESRYVRADSESNDSLVVSSIPIFVMEDNLTDEDESSGHESCGGSFLSESVRMDITEWICRSADREETPRATDLATNFAPDSDDTVVFESSSRDRDASKDHDQNSGEDSISGTSYESNGYTDGFILEDPYASEKYKDGYEPLPGPFGEMIHYNKSGRSISDDASYHSVEQDIDMNGESSDDQRSNASASTPGEDDILQFDTVDDFWMNSLLNLPWVNSGMTMIFDAEKKRMVTMPKRRIERKKLVIDLYTFIIKGVWLVQMAAVGDWIEKTIPIELWFDVFTEKESEDLQNATRAKMYYDIITRGITVTEEWRLRSGFPKVPETLQELVEATQNARARYDMKIKILTEASKKSVDRWIKFVFQGIMEAENLDKMLGHGLPAIRQRVVSKLMHATEFPFQDCWTVTRSLQVPLANRRKMETVIEEQLNGLFQNLNIDNE
ncbi:hypothetical protein IFR05_013894 [Cadophora sp. M221]|nr:hypothetical protein IFR05_013894 [Cadophora sp. M221]